MSDEKLRHPTKKRPAISVVKIHYHVRIPRVCPAVCLVIYYVLFYILHLPRASFGYTLSVVPALRAYGNRQASAAQILIP